jgi:benzoyl-CoA reductase/2-hydroxyglutaryl-CoA dehydratase subunit BcrC/BadD/HgdB
MKLTNKQLRQIIKEEISYILSENMEHATKLERMIDEGDVDIAIYLGQQLLDDEDIYNMFKKKVHSLSRISKKNTSSSDFETLVKIASIFEGKDEDVNSSLDHMINQLEQSISLLNKRERLASSDFPEFGNPGPRALKRAIDKLKKARASLSVSKMTNTYSGSAKDHVYIDDPMMESKK